MASTIEKAITSYSGLSTDIKPTSGAGDNVPNGSRWREVDTKKTYHYNLEDDKWYESDRSAEFISGASAVVDTRMLGIQEQILITLKKIEYHMSLGSNTTLKDEDV